MILFSSFKNSTKRKLFSFLVALFIVSLVIPQTSFAQVKADQYQPESLHELIAYLYGILATLEAQLKVQQGDANTSISATGRTSVSTLTVTDVDNEEATLRGEVEFGSASYVYVYFEYGTRNTFGDKTSRVRANRTTDSKKFDASLEDLREDQKYYYRAVVELPNGNLLRGNTKTLVTDEDDNQSYENGDYLEIDDNEYNEGDLVKVTVEPPSSIIYNQGWVGMYEAGADNNAYLGYKYVNNYGQILLFNAPYEDGEYEFRLFRDYGYILLHTSDSFKVR